MKADNKPSSIRWRKNNGVKAFLMQEANDKKRSLNWLINEILEEYKIKNENKN